MVKLSLIFRGSLHNSAFSKYIVKTTTPLLCRLYNNPAEAEGPRCATLGRLQQAPHAAATRRMMNAEFLPRAQSQADIGHQLDAAAAAPAADPRCSPLLNPGFDKNRLGWSGDPPPAPAPAPAPELSSSQITSQLIEQLLKLRLASVAAAASEGDTVQVRHVSGV